MQRLVKLISILILITGWAFASHAMENEVPRPSVNLPATGGQDAAARPQRMLTAAAWRDDGGWANAPTAIASEGGHTTLQFQGFSQVFAALPALKKDKVYAIDLEMDAQGQVEGVSLVLRLIGKPWTCFGESRYKDLYGKKNVCRLQVRMNQDLPDKTCALFLIASGSGRVEINTVTVEERNDFMEAPVPDNTSQQLIANGDFSLGACGWRIEGRGLKEKVTGKFGLLGETKACTEATFTLYRGRRYPLSVVGTGQASVRLCSAPGKWLEYPVDLRNGTWRREISIPEEQYGEYVESMTFFLEVQTKGADSQIERVTLGGVAAQEAAVVLPAELRKWWGNTTKGKSLPFTLLCRGIPEGTPITVALRSAEGAELGTISVKVARLLDGRYGANFSYAPDRYGWMEFQVRCNGLTIPGPSAELSVLPPVPQQDGDFVFGCHSYNYNRQTDATGTITFPVFDKDTILPRLLRMWGITSNRAHPPEITKWRVVEQQKGVWTFHDAVADAYLSQGVSFLGSLDTTATFASTAPSDATKSNVNAYPVRDIKDWEQYVRVITSHYKGKIRDWEVWNEPDHSFLQLNPALHQQGRVAEYIRLLKAANDTAKTVDPNFRVVAGAVTAGGKDFLIEGIQRGMLESCDAISFHGYGRENAAPALGAKAFSDIVGTLKEAMAARGKKKEIWDSESGVTIPDGREGALLSMNAVKGILARRAAGITRYYLYSAFLKNWPGHDDHRTLFGFNNRPIILQSLCAAYAHFLGDAILIDARDEGSVHLYQFQKKDGTIVFAGWSSGEDCDVSLPGHPAGTVYDANANRIDAIQSGVIRLESRVRYFQSQSNTQ